MKAGGVVQAEQKRTNHLRASGVTKSADDTIGGTNIFHFYHRRPLARVIRSVESFGDDAIEITADFGKPSLRPCQRSRRRRQTNGAVSLQILLCKFFERSAPFRKRRVDQRRALFIHE